MVKSLPCPICRKPVPVTDNPYRPFCGKRCKDIDFASWLDGSYRISRPVDENEFEASTAGGASSSDKDYDPN